jgi:hypothetical protein
VPRFDDGSTSFAGSTSSSTSSTSTLIVKTSNVSHDEMRGSIDSLEVGNMGGNGTGKATGMSDCEGLHNQCSSPKGEDDDGFFGENANEPRIRSEEFK